MGSMNRKITKTISEVLVDLTSTPMSCGIEKFLNGKRYISGYSADAIALGDVQHLSRTATSGQEVTAVDGATNAIAEQQIGVCVKALTAAGITWFQVAGLCEAFVDGDSVDVAAGDFLQLINGDDDFVQDAVESVSSSAIAVDANAAAAALKTVLLLGRLVDIPAAA